MNQTALQTHRCRLLEQRTIDISGLIKEGMFKYVRDAILCLGAQGSPPITVLITSNGGNTRSGLDIYDLLRLYPGKKTGIVIGQAQSIAAVVLQACDRRLIYRHAFMMIHPPSIEKKLSLNTFSQRAEVLNIREILQHDQRLIYKVLSDGTGQPLATIKRQCLSEESMEATAALKFGLVDKII